jgi:HAD superfamily hydrolase (TIGR01509 family)
LIRAIIFDFDGLIIDTESTDFQAWQEIYQEHGCELPLSMWSIAVGSGFSEKFEPFAYLEKQIGRAVDRDDLWARKCQRDLELISQQPVLPGVVDVLIDAKQMRLKLAVASSSDGKWVIGHLTRLGLLHFFDAIRTKDDVQRTKPEPDLFHAALEALQVLPHEAIVFEDSPNGITAAKRAGIYVIAVPNPLTAQMRVDAADMTLLSLGDMPLEALLKRVDDSLED